MNQPTKRLIEASAIILFLVQSIRSLLAMLFCLAYDATFLGNGGSLFLWAIALLALMLVAPLLAPRRHERISRWLTIAAIGCAIARIPVSLDVPFLRLYAAIITTALALLYLSGLLRRWAPLLPPAIGIALFADQVLRALGTTYDPSLRTWWIIPQVIAVVALVWLHARSDLYTSRDDETASAGFGTGIALGAMLFLASSLLALPNAAARWTSGSYTFWVLFGLVTCLLPQIPWIRRTIVNNIVGEGPWPRAILTGTLVIGLLIANRGAPQQAGLALAEALLVFWLLVPWSLSSTKGSASWGLLLGMLLFLLLSMAHGFAYTYPHILRSFEDSGGTIFTIAALCFGLASLSGSASAPSSNSTPALQRGTWALVAGLCILALIVALPPKNRLEQDVPSVRIATYNAHYGFNSHWKLSLDEQARIIAASGANIVALQEVDAGRLSSYGIDHALWLSRRLGMEATYLPTVEHTTGIALLSRMEPITAGSVGLPGDHQPTGLIHTTVSVGGEPLAVHGTWLGLHAEDRARQIESALGFMTVERAVLAGDLNSEPDSPTAESLRQAGFEDPFTLGTWPSEPTFPSEHPRARIDYVWLLGVTANDAQVLPDEYSDHLLVVVEAR